MCAQGILALAAVLLALSGATADSADLDQLCSGRMKSITHVSHAKALVEESKSYTGNACDHVKLPLSRLEIIIEAVESGRICNLDFVEKVRQFKADFISVDGAIPPALVQFFNSLCFQVSAECKKSLINNLELDTKGKISAEDYAIFESASATNSNDNDDGDENVSGPRDFDDILLPGDIESVIGKHYKDARLRMLINPVVGEKMRKMVEICPIKFKPFYSKLILPIVELSNLGYNFQGEMLQRELDELRRNKLVQKWFNIVQVCESFQTSDIFIDKANLVGDSKSLTFVDAAEAEKLSLSQGSITDFTSSDKPLEYEPLNGSNLNELWIQDHKELKKQVDNYKASYNRSRRVKSTIRKNLGKMLKQALSSGGVHFKSLNSLKCSGRNNCEVQVEDVTGVALDEAKTQKGQNLVKRDSGLGDAFTGIGSILFCIIFFPCIIAMAIMWALGSGPFENRG